MFSWQILYWTIAARNESALSTSHKQNSLLSLLKFLFWHLTHKLEHMGASEFLLFTLWELSFSSNTPSFPLLFPLLSGSLSTDLMNVDIPNKSTKLVIHAYHCHRSWFLTSTTSTQQCMCTFFDFPNVYNSDNSLFSRNHSKLLPYYRKLTLHEINAICSKSR